MKNLGVENLDHMFLKIYTEQASQLTDSRQQKKVKHPFKAVVGIVFFAILARNDEWTEIADLAVDERETLQRYLELPNEISGTACECGRKRTRRDQLDCYIRVVIAADGKEIHNTGKVDREDVCDARNLSEFNVMSTE